MSYGGGSNYTAGTGLTLTGSQFSINIPALYVTNAMLAGSIDASTKLTGNLPAAQMTSNAAAMQTNTIGVNFTTTSASLVDTGLTVTPSSARTRAVVFAVVQWTEANINSTESFAFTNTTPGNTYNTINSAVPTSMKLCQALCEAVTTMGTACKLQVAVSGGGTLTIYSAGAVEVSIET